MKYDVIITFCSFLQFFSTVRWVRSWMWLSSHRRVFSSVSDLINSMLSILLFDMLSTWSRERAERDSGSKCIFSPGNSFWFSMCNSRKFSMFSNPSMTWIRLRPAYNFSMYGSLFWAQQYLKFVSRDRESSFGNYEY